MIADEHIKKNGGKLKPEADPGRLPEELVFEGCVAMLAENRYAVMDQFLTAEEVTRIASGLENKFSRDAFKKAGIGQDGDYQKDAGIRGDFIHWVDTEKDFNIKRFFAPRMKNFITYINRAMFLSIKDWEMHYAVYPKGAFYKRHLDQFKNDDNRVLTFICYLNFDWDETDGGALRIYERKGTRPETSVDILPCAGRFVCFESGVLEHEVLPTNRKRYSLSGWLLKRKRDLNFLK